ncbi:hypothetical protein CF326_g9022 [Tilletia indica]|nr:hypothetical protein CF326_g9022 [Tilletia indica]
MSFEMVTPKVLWPKQGAFSDLYFTGQAPKRSAQPDFSFESAIPSLGAAAAPPKVAWSKRLAVNRNAAPAVSSGGIVVPANWVASATNVPIIARFPAEEVVTHLYDADQTVTQPNKLGQVIPGIKVDASTTRQNGVNTHHLHRQGQNEADVQATRREITVPLARSVTFTDMIPSNLHAFVIGAKGKNIKSITYQTGARIKYPNRIPLPLPRLGSGRPGLQNEKRIPFTIDPGHRRRAPQQDYRLSE